MDRYWLLVFIITVSVLAWVGYGMFALGMIVGAMIGLGFLALMRYWSRR